MNLAFLQCLLGGHSTVEDTVCLSLKFLAALGYEDDVVSEAEVVDEVALYISSYFDYIQHGFF